MSKIVTNENKLRTYATTESEVSYESETNQRAYTWSNVSYNYTAGDTILLVKNTNSTDNLISSASSSKVKVYKSGC